MALTRRDLLCATILFLSGCEKKDSSTKTGESKLGNSEKNVSNQDEVEEFYSSIMNNYQNLDLLSAMEKLGKIFQKFPDNDYARWAFADSAFITVDGRIRNEYEFRQLVFSLIHYESLLKENPNHHAALINLGVGESYYGNSTGFTTNRAEHSQMLPIKERKQHIEKALNHFDTAVQLHPESFAAHYGRANALREVIGLSKEPTEAIEQYKKALSIAPQNKLLVSESLNISDEEEVFVGYTPHCVISPTLKRHISALSMVIATEPVVIQGKTVAYIPSENDFEAFCHFHIARLSSFFTMKDYDAAKLHYEKAIGLNPKVPTFHREQMQFLDSQGDYSGKSTASDNYDRIQREIMARMK